MIDQQTIPASTHYTVFVLGEIGKSPRMQYHALSLAKLDPNSTVDLVGFQGPQPHRAIREQSNIVISAMDTQWYNWTQPLMRKHFLLFLLFAPIKLLIQWTCILLHLLFFTSKHGERNVFLVQNPPAIPTLVLLPFYLCLMRCVSLVGSKRQFWLVVDWHNYAHTLMVNVSGSGGQAQQSIGPLKRLILSLATFLEVKFAKWFADGHLCVSHAMKRDLKKRFQIDAIVHYDKPPRSIFAGHKQQQQQQGLDLNEKHDLFKRVFGTVKEDDAIERTLFTERNTQTGEVSLIEKKDRPALIVSSTSWTPDEDFSILLKAVELYDRKQTDSKNRKLQLIITGSGPLKSYYEQKMREMTLKYCQLGTKWLEAEDYPKLLSCCDLGVCLHYSSSGVDLPMKVVDMFGSGIPVCAIDFEALPELVQNNENGYIFETSEQLADQLYELLVQDADQVKLSRMKQHVASHFQTTDWDSEWSQTVKPLLINLLK